MKKHIILLNYTLLVFFLMLSCTSKSKKNSTTNSINKKGKSENIVVKSENIELFNVDNSNAEKVLVPSGLFNFKMNLSQLILDIEIIPLETTPRSIIGKVDKILFDSNSYFIHDKKNNKLLRFDNEGKFLNSIGTIGKGPEELLNIWDVSIDSENKLISILDANSRRISKYTFSGEYKGSQSLFYAMSQHEYEKNNLVFSTSKAQRNTHIPVIDSYSLILANSNSVPLGLAFKNLENSNTFKTLNPLRKFDNSIYYHHPYSDGIWKIQDIDLIPIIKFEFEKNGLPSDAWRLKMNNIEFNDFIHKYTRFSGEYIITDEFCFFQFFGQKMVSNLFYNRKLKSLIYGKGFDFSEEKPLTSFFSTPIGYKSDGSFIGLKEAFYVDAIKSNIMKNEELKRSFKNSDWEKIMKIKETDNPVIVTYKLKDF